MNLNFIIKQFKRINTLETFVSYKFLSRYYNKKPLKTTMHKEIKNMNENKENTIVDDDIIKSLISNDQLPDKTTKQINIHKQFINQELQQLPKEIINYCFDPLKHKSIAMKKSKSHTNIDIIKMKQLALSKNWYTKINKPKQKPIIDPNEESTNMHRTLKQCLSTQLRETKFDEHKKMIDYLEQSLKKKLLFIAETIPKISLKELKKDSLFHQRSSIKLFSKHSNNKQRANENNSSSIIPPIKIPKNIPLCPNKVLQTRELYEEIERNDIDPTQSYLINKPFIPLLQRKIYSQLKSNLKSPQKEKTNKKALEIMKMTHSKINYLTTKKDKLLFIIRPEISCSINFK